VVQALVTLKDLVHIRLGFDDLSYALLLNVTVNADQDPHKNAG
jgi:hypothetical protein